MKYVVLTNVSTTNTSYLANSPQHSNDAMAKLEQAVAESLAVN